MVVLSAVLRLGRKPALLLAPEDGQLLDEAELNLHATVSTWACDTTTTNSMMVKVVALSRRRADAGHRLSPGQSYTAVMRTAPPVSPSSSPIFLLRADRVAELFRRDAFRPLPLIGKDTVTDIGAGVSEPPPHTQHAWLASTPCLVYVAKLSPELSVGNQLPPGPQ